MLNMTKRKRLIYSLMAAVFVLLIPVFALSGIAQMVFIVLIFVMTALFFAAWIILWRCPHCGHHLGRIDDSGRYCRYCGKELY